MRLVRIEHHVGGIARAEINAVVGFQLVALAANAVHVRAVPAVLVHDVVRAVFAEDLRVVARHPRVRDDQVLAGLPANGKRQPLQDDIALLRPFDVEQHR